MGGKESIKTLEKKVAQMKEEENYAAEKRRSERMQILELAKGQQRWVMGECSSKKGGKESRSSKKGGKESRKKLEKRVAQKQEEEEECSTGERACKNADPGAS
ncbi:hypothetical protein NDU88_000060 [Pleurodeles waltl]|uniref:Uncharacterized protein n=1 Tax=Pleurodeles waltl TaxID=8319 RepID=A0AAV7V809_PLEWA|nr:hypothetical protein NDU88_000060 [Pleurodeles waltl]